MKPKIGDTVQFKKSGITGTVEKILRGACVIKTPTSMLSAWPEDLIVVGLSEVSLEKEMDEHQKLVDEIMTIQGIEPIEAEMKEVWHCPEGYIFKDENGNEILTSKIILEKKKKRYPKTYEECCEALEYIPHTDDIIGYKWDILQSLQKLLICRDAYWKIYGEENGLDKPWEPDWREERYIIYRNQDDIIGGYREAGCVESHFLAFPTKEMRDAFKENFDPDIEICKELL